MKQQIVIVDWSSPAQCIWVGLSGESFPFYSISLSAELGDFKWPEKWQDLYLFISSLFRRIFLDLLKIRPKQVQVLIIESLFLSRGMRDCLHSVLLNDYQVNGVSFQSCPKLIALACGSSSGCVVHINDEETTTVCFAHQRMIVSSIRTGVGLAACLKELRKILESKGISSLQLSSSTLLRIFKDMCFQAASASSEEKKEWQIESSSLFLSPLMRLSQDDLETCLLPLLHGCTGISELCEHGVCESVFSSCDAVHLEDRGHVLRNIIFAGPASMIPGLKDIVLAGLRSSLRLVTGVSRALLSIKDEDVSMCQSAGTFDGDKLGWIGGSIFASLSCNEPSFRAFLSEIKDKDSAKVEATVGPNITESIERRVSAPDWMALTKA